MTLNIIIFNNHLTAIVMKRIYSYIPNYQNILRETMDICQLSLNPSLSTPRFNPCVENPDAMIRYDSSSSTKPISKEKSEDGNTQKLIEHLPNAVSSMYKALVGNNKKQNYLSEEVLFFNINIRREFLHLELMP